MGCSPNGYFHRTAHINVGRMSTPKQLKPGSGKTGRSEFHPLIIPALPFQPASPAGSDVIGGVAVLCLWFGMLYVMRLLLAN
jgi:hypothetical protein